MENKKLYKNFNVVEIFNSIEGEGIRAGYRATFIRLNGCNLNCSYCDSRYANGNSYTITPLDKIIDICNAYNCNKITITGGEPLIQPDVEYLIANLLAIGYEINIETNGSVSIKTCTEKVNEVLKSMGVGTNISSNLMFTVDYKCSTSEMNSQMFYPNFYTDCNKNDVIKFVVGNTTDLMEMRNIVIRMKSYKKEQMPHIFVSPVFGKIEPKEIVSFIIKNKLNDVRIQLQIHKIIYPPTMRGV